MLIERREEKNGLVLLLRGRLDAGHCRNLEDELESALRRGAFHVALDMDGVVFMSSAGIRSLLRYKKTLASLGGDLSIRRPSEFVREILGMVGMNAVFFDSEDIAPVRSTEAVTRYDLASPGGFVVDLPAPGESRAFGPGVWGLGVGSFEGGAGVPGEVLAAEGFALMLPPGDGEMPDFMAASGDFVPSVNFSSGLALRGEPSCCLRFVEELPGISLSRLARSALDATGGDAAALAIVGETSGLVGASLSLRPPDDGSARSAFSPADGDFFAFPAVREHLAYWPEKRYDRHLAVVAGVAVRGDPGPLAAQVRALGDGDDLKGHFHGAVFPFRAIPQGKVELRSVLAKLFDALTPVGLLHLLHDRRPISGAGESAFLSGALWAGRLAAPEGGNS